MKNSISFLRTCLLILLALTSYGCEKTPLSVIDLSGMGEQIENYPPLITEASAYGFDETTRYPARNGFTEL